MGEYALVQLELLLRLVVAAVCGCLIGYERKNRLKEAGVRTHMIVALGAALVMIVSKYGFGDVTGLTGIALDPSRVAAQVVSGVGFLGAGMIFVRHRSVSGLTTAAGIWATAGIGLAVGAKLYVMGVAATALVLIAQVAIYKHYKWFRVPMAEQVNILFSESDDAISGLQEMLAAHKIEIVNLKAERTEAGGLEVELFVKLPPKYDRARLMDLFKDNPHVRAIEY